MNSAVGGVYRSVIDDLIRNIRPEFVAEGMEESALQELQSLWESKLVQSGAVAGYIPDSVHTEYEQSYGNPYFSHHYPPSSSSASSSSSSSSSSSYLPDHNFPHTTTSESSYHTTSFAQDLSRAHASLNTLHSTAPSSYTSHATYSAPLGRPAPYLPPANSLPGIWGDIPHSSGGGGGGGSSSGGSNAAAISVRALVNGPIGVPQHDGASDQVEPQPYRPKISRPVSNERLRESRAADEVIRKRIKAISQVDGNSDDDEVDEDGDDKPKDDDEELGSDLDDEDEAEPDTDHLVLCQFEKVTRIKNKRKVNLKDGVMHLNGRDTLFHKATGEFEW